MNNSTKVYPKKQPRTEMEQGSSWQTFQGCAVGILFSEDISLLEILIDSVHSDEIPKDFQDEIINCIEMVIERSRKKMTALHNVLGAYDVDHEGKPTKPMSELNDRKVFDQFKKGSEE